MDTLYLWVTGGLLVVSAAVLFLPVTAARVDLSPTELGYLRRGLKGAVLTALTGLYIKGLIEPRPAGGIRRTGRPLSGDEDPFERIVHRALSPPAGTYALRSRPAVYWAGRGLAEDLADARLMPGRFRMTAGWALLTAAPVLAVVRFDSGGPVPVAAAILVSTGLALMSRRTIAGHRALHRHRREHTRLLAAWRPAKQGQYFPAEGAAGGGPMATGLAESVIMTRGCALGMGANLAVIGLPEVDFGGGGAAGGGYDGGGGDGGGDGGY